MAFDEGNSGNVLYTELLEGSTVIVYSPQHLHLAPIQVVVDIDSRAKGPFTSTRENDQTRAVLDRVPHGSRQLVEHLDTENVERWLIKYQPQNVIMATNMQVRHTSIPKTITATQETYLRLAHTSISCTATFSSITQSSSTGSRYNSIASRIFSSASSRVSPSLMQPGNDGT